jgi:predicted Zn-dependent protease
LIAQAEKHSLAPHHAVGVGSKGELSLRRGDADDGIRLLRTCLETLPGDPVFTGDLAEGLAMRGQWPEANLSEAEDWLLRSLELARRQTALAWELRTAMSLALLKRKQDRHDEAHGVLAAVYNRFTEGFETSDLRAARRVLDELEQPASAARIHATSIPKRPPLSLRRA